MWPHLFGSNELEELRRAVKQRDTENAVLRDMLATAVEIADLAILMALEHSRSHGSDPDRAKANLIAIPQRQLQ
jgi:hypothetical protein